MNTLCKKFVATIVSTGLLFAIADNNSAQATSFSFSDIPAQNPLFPGSPSSSTVNGTITFDDSITQPGQNPKKPTVATFFGAIQSYEITDGTQTFEGNGIFSNNEIIVYNNNIIDINDPEGRVYLGDGLDFLITDNTTRLFLRFLYPDVTVLNSLSLSDISIQNARASEAPQLPSNGGGGALFTLLQVTDSGSLVIEDGTYFNDDFLTSTTPPISVPEPASTLALLAFGAVSAGCMLKRQQHQKATAKVKITNFN